MALNFTRIVTGLKLKAKALLTSDSLGELEASTSDSKLHYHNGSVRSPVVTESSTATLTNKTIDANGTGNSISNLETADLAAGVLNTSTTLATASNTQVPSALAVKTYVDDNLALQNEASEISYNNATSGLIATNLQASTDEIVDMLDTHVTDPTDAHDATAISSIPSGNLAATDVQGALNELQSNIDTNYTAFTDHVNDAVDAHDASAISNVPSGNLAATDVQGALNELQSDIDTRATVAYVDSHLEGLKPKAAVRAATLVAGSAVIITELSEEVNVIVSPETSPPAGASIVVEPPASLKELAITFIAFMLGAKASMKALSDYRSEAQRMMKEKMHGMKKKDKKEEPSSMTEAMDEAEDLLDDEHDTELGDFADKITTDDDSDSEEELDRKIAALMAKKRK